MDTCNKVAQAATIAQDAPDGKDTQQAAQTAGSDPVKDFEDMRADLAWACRLAWKADLTERGVDRLMGIEKRWGG